LNEISQPAIGVGRPGHASSRPRVPLRAVVGIGVGLLGAVVLAGCGSSSSSSPPTSNAVAATPDGLRTLARSLKQPIYWVGPRTGVTYERTTLASGRILVRYLPAGVKVGASEPYLTVGTYTLPDAYAATQRAASKPGAVRIKVSTSAVAFSTTAHPLNVWLTYPGSRYQIEVFDPTPGRARSLVEAGDVTRVPGSPKENRPVVVSPKSLAKVATAAKRPIYWAGPLPNKTYELTETTQGGFLLRYLPPEASIGIATPQLTIGTYPFAQPLAAIKRLGLAKGATLIKLAGGGLAVADPHFPRSIYLAFPGSNYEVEVFDPSLTRARQLVTSGQITAVP
jgi:hypothetical protein